MADNVTLPGTGENVASDDIGGLQYQRIKLIHGNDGVNDGDVSLTNGLPVFITDPSGTTAFGPVTSANTALFAAVNTANERMAVLQITGSFVGGVRLEISNDGTNYSSVYGYCNDFEQLTTDRFDGPCVIHVPLSARWFRAVTTSDFSGSVSGSYVLRSLDSAMPYTKTVLYENDSAYMSPIAGGTPTGNPVRVTCNEAGHIVPADGQTFSGFRASLGTIVQVDTTGYNSVCMQLVGTWVGTVTFQTSNDGTTWNAVAAWPVAGAVAPVTTSTANGQWLIASAGRFVRATVTAYTSGFPAAIAVLRNAAAFAPQSTPSVTIAANSTVNLAQVGGTSTVTAGVAGMQAMGGNVAVGVAPTANPIPLAWDGANTRRILTDASSGGIVLGSSAVANGQTSARINQTATAPAATNVKASAGRLTSLSVSQNGTVAGFLHVYNAAATTLGTTNDTWVFSIPGTVGVYQVPLPDGGLFLSAGIGLAFTNGSPANDNTAFGSAPSLTANYTFI